MFVHGSCQRPVAGFEQLLPCAHVVIPLKDPPPSATELNNNATSSGTSDPAFFDRTEVVLNSTVAAILGLPPASNAQDHPPPGETGGEGDDGDGGVAFDVGGGGLKEQGQAGGGGGGTGGFDVSVLCTTFGDLNVLFDTRHSGMDPRLADALLWNVNVSEEALRGWREDKSSAVGTPRHAVSRPNWLFQLQLRLHKYVCSCCWDVEG